MDDSPSKAPADRAPPPIASFPSERVISTRDLLAGSRRVWIEHDTVRYLLQITRSGKLILTK